MIAGGMFSIHVVIKSTREMLGRELGKHHGDRTYWHKVQQEITEIAKEPPFVPTFNICIRSNKGSGV
ncbi:1695_t:CDS:2, partial [Rhizophagus irregularis]